MARWMRLALATALFTACATSDDDKTDDTDVGDDTDDTPDTTNSPPPTPEIRITPADPKAGQTLRVEVDEVVDPDGDAVTYHAFWRTDDRRAEFEQRGFDIPGDQVRRGKTWGVLVVARDGTAESEEVEVEVVIGNWVPEITSFTVTPAAPGTLDALEGTVEVSDGDEDDSPTVDWTWSVNGTQVATGRGLTDRLPPANYEKGDEVLVEIVVSDGMGGEVSDSRTIEIVNTPPSPPVVAIVPPVADPGTTLECVIVEEGIDPDGDPLTYAFLWEVDGQPFSPSSAAQTTWPGDTVPGIRVSEDEVWACTVASDDGEDTSTTSWEAVRVGETPPDFDGLALGFQYSCALVGGRATCWGFDVSGETEAPDLDFQALAAADQHTCGILDDGSITCWGINRARTNDVPEGAFQEISAWGAHTCAVSDVFELACWGDNTLGASTPPEGTYDTVAVGNVHGCALDGLGEAACWGDDSNGKTTPEAGPFLTLAAGANHTCALKTDNTVACWGVDLFGQSTPPAGTFTALAAGDTFTCGVQTDRTLACWGQPLQGRTAPPPGEFAQVWAGTSHACAATEQGAVACWGEGVGGITTPPFESAVAFQGSSDAYGCWLDDAGLARCFGSNLNGTGVTRPPYANFTQIDVYLDHGCGVTEQGEAICWGANASGQSSPPTGGGAWTKVDVGASHSCGLRASGDVQCWGSNIFGESNARQNGPYIDVTAGGQHSCAVRQDGTVDCWGLGLLGALNVPQNNGEVYVEVYGGGQHTCGLLDDGAVKCWGGVPLTGVNRNQDPSFDKVAAGETHNCGLKSDGTIQCWGANLVGERVAPEGTFVDVAVGLDWSCAVDADGGVTCWGSFVRSPARPPAGAP